MCYELFQIKALYKYLLLLLLYYVYISRVTRVNLFRGSSLCVHTRRQMSYQSIQHAKYIDTMHVWYRGNMSTIFSSNSEAKASELLENLEDMFLRYY